MNWTRQIYYVGGLYRYAIKNHPKSRIFAHWGKKCCLQIQRNYNQRSKRCIDLSLWGWDILKNVLRFDFLVWLSIFTHVLSLPTQVEVESGWCLAVTIHLLYSESICDFSGNIKKSRAFFFFFRILYKSVNWSWKMI